MSSRIRATIYVAFFFSGAASLILETYWTRALTLVFGCTSLAISTVLAAFMGGLGFGCWLAARYSNRIRNPLRTYALFEVLIGTYALLAPIGFRALPQVARFLHNAVGDHSSLLILGRFAASLVLIGIPTTLMGTTLPLLSRVMVDRRANSHRIGAGVGGLYATNTAGALCGALVAGFFLLPFVGGRVTNALAGVTDLTMGFVLLLAAYRVHTAPEVTPATSSAVTVRSLSARIALVAFAVSGAAAMALEVLWTRSVAVLLGSSVYSFTIVLVVFLGGIALGSGLQARLTRHTRPERAATLLYAALSVAVLTTSLSIDALPTVYLRLVSWLGFNVRTLPALQVALVGIVLVPPTLFMGALCPLTVRICVGDAAGVDRQVAVAYGANTIGAIVGSFAGGFVILPALGLQRGIHAGALVYGLMAAAFGVFAWDRSKVRRLWPALIPAALTVATVVMPRWHIARFQSGVFRPAIALNAMGLAEQGVEIVYYRDGVSSTVSVERRHDFRGTPIYTLRNNGKPDASSGLDMPTQIMLGLLPSLLVRSPAPTSAIIGYGSGTTVGAVSQTSAKRIDVVELEPAVIEAARFFDDVNHRPLADPRVHLHLDDGRNFLFQADRRFDLIISEPPNPWVAGVASLFTREFWSLAHRRLAPGGIFCQWIQLYELKPERVKTLFRTFALEFPYTYVFLASRNEPDAILIASDEPLSLDAGDLERRLREPRVAAEAQRIGVREPGDILVLLTLGAGEVGRFAEGAPLNTDDNMLVEYAAPRDMIETANQNVSTLLLQMNDASWPYGRFEEWIRGIEDGPRLARLIESLLRNGRLAQALRLLDRAKGPDPAGHELVDLLQAEIMRPSPLSATLAESPLARAESALERGEPQSARRLLSGLPTPILARDPELAVHYAYVTLRLGAPMPAAVSLHGLPQHPEVLERWPEAAFLLGRAYFAVGRHGAGVNLLKRYLATRMVASQ